MNPPFGLTPFDARLIQIGMQTAGWSDEQIEPVIARFAREMQEAAERGESCRCTHEDAIGTVSYRRTHGGIILNVEAKPKKKGSKRNG